MESVRLSKGFFRFPRVVFELDTVLNEKGSVFCLKGDSGSWVAYQDSVDCNGLRLRHL
jgi:hypothetical protein